MNLPQTHSVKHYHWATRQVFWDVYYPYSLVCIISYKFLYA